MSDNRKYLLRDWNWVRQYRLLRGTEAFYGYVNEVYRFLDGMKPGTCFRLENNVRPENLDLFIKVCCMFIEEKPPEPALGGSYYEFNDDCTVFRRVALPCTRLPHFTPGPSPQGEGRKSGTEDSLKGRRRRELRVGQGVETPLSARG
jgi:hypothetical protein